MFAVETAVFEEPSRCFDDDRPADRRASISNLISSTQPGPEVAKEDKAG
jgi:hypothetical protein